LKFRTILQKLMKKDSYYSILGVSIDADFKELKKAYFSRAKECHPDRFGGSKAKEAEFKILVQAFDVLSDPVKKKEYDQTLGIDSETEAYRYTDTGFSIMDSPADDTLEEIIVGNSPPETATMATLFLDLEKTEVFMTFREGKNCYYQRRLGPAMALFRTAVKSTPHNILYRFYLARTCVAAGRYREAIKHYKYAIAVGDSRVPAQRLERLRAELNTIRKKKHPWWYAVGNLFSQEEPYGRLADTEEAMIAQANRSIARILAEDKKKNRKKLK
jgi:curved DNA-binding protein CbpA